MEFVVDGWSPEYGSSMREVEDLTEAVAQLDPAIERQPDAWSPIAPVPVTRPDNTLFVDGVRRIEARLWIRSDLGGAEKVPGLCASYAAGVVRSTPTSARVEVAEVHRALLTTAEDCTDVVTRLGTWTAIHAQPDPNKQVFDVLSNALQRKLTELEIICAANARANAGASEEDLLVIDGPLRGRTRIPRALGVVKSHQAAYLPAELNAVVASLEAGQRTPIFLLGTTGAAGTESKRDTWERYSWYLRLPGASDSPWAGVVRVECSPDVGNDGAIDLANLSQAVLPRYASESFKDPRAPQNLYPIGGLEKQLRHRLGDPALLHRALLSATR